MGWWVNSDGDIRQSDFELHDKGYSGLPDPQLMIERFDGSAIYAYTVDSTDESRFVPVIPERITGELRWRWVHAGGRASISQEELRELGGEQ